MKHTLDTANPLEGSRRRLVSANLKCCPLCGAVNAQQNEECFVCAWRGAFDTSAESVEVGIKALLDRCPELCDLLSPKPTAAERIRQGLLGFVHRLFHRPFDTYA